MERESTFEAHQEEIIKRLMSTIKDGESLEIATFQYQQEIGIAHEMVVDSMIEDHIEEQEKKRKAAERAEHLSVATPSLAPLLAPFGKLIDYPDAMKLARFCIRETVGYKDLEAFLLGGFIYAPGAPPPHNVTFQFLDRFNDCRSAEAVFVAYLNHFVPNLELTEIVKNKILFDECFAKYWEAVCELDTLIGATASVIANPLKSLRLTDSTDKGIAKARLSRALQVSYGAFIDSDAALLTNYNTYLLIREPTPPAEGFKNLVTAGMLLQSDYPLMKPYRPTKGAEVRHEEVRLTLDSIYFLKDLPKPTASLLDKLNQHLVGDFTRVEIENAASQVYADINKYELRQSITEGLTTDYEDTFESLGVKLGLAIIFQNKKDDFDFL